MIDKTEVTVLSATIDLLKKYRHLCENQSRETVNPVEDTSFEHLAWLCDLALENQDSFPIDKMSRLLGFVQGVLTMKGIITVAEERALTRPLFHNAYRNAGIDVPATKNRITKD